jgi:3-deoxy-manno-octulosonate cytidylyltransferase (CMP-KDO synthetase)
MLQYFLEDDMKAVGIIPARFSSTRFPGKPLAMIAGKTMIERVYKNAEKAKSLSGLFVATDDERIFSTIKSFGGKAVMTSPDCRSGSDRIAEAAEQIDAEIILNIQGDEPLLDHEALDRLVALFENDPDLLYGTLAAPIISEPELRNPNIVKVVLDRDDRCLYFSRSPVPFLRDMKFSQFAFWRHIGIYGFRKEFLLKFRSLPQGRLEAAESLEQLRALENGITIKAVKLKEWKAVSVDTPDDLKLVEEIIKKGDFTPPS